MNRVKIAALLLALGLAQGAAAADVTALRSWRAPDNTRIVLDLSAPVQFHVNAMANQIVVELDDSQASGQLAPQHGGGPVKAVRVESQGKTLRLLVDLSGPVRPHVFQLPPIDKYSQRLVVDLFDQTPPASDASSAAPPAPSATPKVAAAHPAASATSAPPRLAAAKPAATPVATPANPDDNAGQAEDKPAPAHDVKGSKASTDNRDSREPAVKRGRNIIIAVDAGHGGEDSGAIGPDGDYEKNVTLAIARELVGQLRAQPGISAVLTRDGDYFIPLQDRRQIARRKYKADIFISVHADSAPTPEARGASVFALSLKGANTATSRFAAMLADHENRADLIGGVAIDKSSGGDNVLRNVLADMVVTGSLEHSLHMAHNILGNLADIGRLHSRQVEQAGFAVLKEPGMVSLLVETGFISNPEEEKRLTSAAHQRDLAHAIMEGAVRYCQQYPAPGTYFAWLHEQRGRGAPTGRHGHSRGTVVAQEGAAGNVVN